MRTRIAAVLVCLLLALSLAGCVHADRAVTLNNDGTGTYTFTVGLSSQLMSLGGSSLTDSMNKYGDEVKQDGGSYSRYSDGGYSYWKYVRPFTSVQQLDDFLGQAPQSQINTGTPSGDEIQVTQRAGFFTTTFHVTGHMSLKLPNATQPTPDILKDARESFAITMPGWVNEHHGGQQSGNTVSYTVHFGEEATIDVTGGGLNAGHIALVAGGALLALVLVIAGLLLVLLRARRQPAKPAVAFVAPTASYYTPTQPGSDAPTLPATPGYPVDYPATPPAQPPE